MNITKERVEYLINRVRLERHERPGADFPYYTDLLAILDDYAERIDTNETKAGGTEKISGSQNDASRPAPRHVPPGPTDADERLELRPEVLAFARLMEDRLRANEGKGGWNGESAEWLLARLKGAAEDWKSLCLINQDLVKKAIENIDALKAEVERLNTWHSTLSAAWQARAEKAKADLERARPLLEAVEKAEIADAFGSEEPYIGEESLDAIEEAAIAYKETKETKAGEGDDYPALLEGKHTVIPDLSYLNTGIPAKLLGVEPSPGPTDADGITTYTKGLNTNMGDVIVQFKCLKVAETGEEEK